MGPFANQLADCQTQDNLAIKALALLRQSKPDLPFFSVCLQKNVPIASGVGGGSCDAAFIIKRIARDYDIDLNSSNVQQSLLNLGADMPVCVGGYPALMSGIGEVVEPIAAFPSYAIVVVNPLISLSASDVYKNFHTQNKGHYSDALPPHPVVKDQKIWTEFLHDQTNDLQPPAENQCPAIYEIIKNLSIQEGALLSRMSGSGATCFALFTSNQMAIKAASDLAEQYPAYWIKTGSIAEK